MFLRSSAQLLARAVAVRSPAAAKRIATSAESTSTNAVPGEPEKVPFVKELALGLSLAGTFACVAVSSLAARY